jgi:hypothetical protein
MHLLVGTHVTLVADLDEPNTFIVFPAFPFYVFAMVCLFPDMARSASPYPSVRLKCLALWVAQHTRSCHHLPALSVVDLGHLTLAVTGLTRGDGRIAVRVAQPTANRGPAMLPGKGVLVPCPD